MSFLELLLLLGHLSNHLFDSFPNLFLLFLVGGTIRSNLQISNNFKYIDLPHLNFLNNVDRRLRFVFHAFPGLPFFGHLLNFLFVIRDDLANRVNRVIRIQMHVVTGEEFGVGNKLLALVSLLLEGFLNHVEDVIHLLNHIFV